MLGLSWRTTEQTAAIRRTLRQGAQDTGVQNPLGVEKFGSAYNLGVLGSVTVYVDDERHPFAVTLMCHMSANSLDALLTMVDCAGVKRKWLQKLPKAFWMHFDIAQSKRKFVAAAGALETDRYGPLEHPARLAGDQAELAQVARIRARAE